MRTTNRLGLLVGSNPLPNYIAAVVLQPREVVLLYSPETAGPRDHLKAALGARDSTMIVSGLCVDDASDVRKIRDACNALEVDHLHYSGGTKPMAAHARKACQLAEGQASYLDERKGLLRFDDGYDVRLSERDLGLTLNVVLTLHGAERSGSTTAVAGAPTETDVRALRGRVLEEPAFSRCLYKQFRPNDQERTITEAKKKPWAPAEHGVELSAASVPDTNWSAARYKAWDRFLTGLWLERWTAELVQSCVGASVPVEVGVNCKRKQPVATEFEIDIALVRGHRLYVVSCTTAWKKALCKSKLFEVAMRARQMGGDLARSALVCLLDGCDDQGTYVDQLRGDIGSLWEAPNIPSIFGLADLREWEGNAGGPNLSTLQKWLDS